MVRHKAKAHYTTHKPKSDKPIKLKGTRIISFGKYIGRSYTEIAKLDPRYLNWLIITTSNLEWKRLAQDALSQSGAGGKIERTSPLSGGRAS